MYCWCLFFFFKQKTAYEMRISDWSSDVCSSDLAPGPLRGPADTDSHADLGLVARDVEGVQEWCGGSVEQDQRERERMVEGLSGHRFGDPGPRLHGPGGSDLDEVGRPEERRGGEESVRTCRSRWARGN